MTLYGDCVKICEDFLPNFGDKGTGSCITTTLCRVFLTKNNVTVMPHQHCFTLFTGSKMKLKGHRFEGIEVIKAEQQAVLTPSQSSISRMYFKDWQKRWGRRIRAEG
jgi:hypothetical protein